MTTMARYRRPFSIALCFMSVVVALSAQDRERAAIPEKYKWNLADVYPSDTSWRGAKEAFQRLRGAGVVFEEQNLGG